MESGQEKVGQKLEETPEGRLGGELPRTGSLCRFTQLPCRLQRSVEPGVVTFDLAKPSDGLSDALFELGM